MSTDNIAPNSAADPLRVHVAPDAADQLQIDDLIALEDAVAGNVSLRALRNLIARFVVDPTGQPVPEEAARARLGRLTAAQFMALAKELTGSIEAAKESALPPTKP